jgi:hypothetical protein
VGDGSARTARVAIMVAKQASKQRARMKSELCTLLGA